MNELAPINDVIIAKVGTNVLTDTHEDGSQELNPEAFERIGDEIMSLEAEGMNVVLVTSAAITAGMAESGLTMRPSKSDLPGLQRLSSIGWRPLLNAWDAALPGRVTGSLQLTKQELNLMQPERSEALQTTHSLLSHNQTPIANENDAITHSEIKFGDNDTLAAYFAAHIGASALFGSNVRVVLLSDVHGVYEDKNDPSTLIPSIEDIEAYEHLADDTDSENGTGGMATKFAAARIVTKAGMPMWIAHGRTDNAIQLAMDNEIGTMFVPELMPRESLDSKRVS